MWRRIFVLLFAILFTAHLFAAVDGAAQVELKLKVRAINAKLLKESRDEDPDVKEDDRWPHFDADFEMVTVDMDGRRVPINWTEQDGFIKLENKNAPDHTQRATFMRRVGEAVERWAKRQDRADYYESYALAAKQWSMVLEYLDWEEANLPADGSKSSVKIDLRKIRDLASYNEIFCRATASRSPGGSPPVVDELNEFANLRPESIGPVVLKRWRELLISRFSYRNAASAVKANDEYAKKSWRGLLDATDVYRGEVEKYPKILTPLKDAEIRQEKADRISLPKQSLQN